MKKTLHLFPFIMALAMMAICPQKSLATTSGWIQCGSCEYQISNGLLTIRPIDNGTEGTLDNSQSLFANRQWQITSVKFEGKINSAANSCAFIFQDDYITSIDFGNFNTENAETMKGMFQRCPISSLDLSKFNTAKVTDMSSMFSGCSSLTSLDLSSFNTANVTDMAGMFNRCSVSSLDLSGFNTSKVTNMNSMFSSSNVTSLDLSSFDTGNVTNMMTMFFDCGSLTSLNLSSFNTSKVTTMYSMFMYCNSLTSIDLSNFDASSLTDMSQMFYECGNLRSVDLSGFNTSKVTDMGSVFSKSSNLESITLGNFDMSSVTKTSYMFNNTTNLANVIFRSYPYLLDGTFNSLSADVNLMLDDKSVIYAGENHFPSLTSASYSRSMSSTWGTVVLPFDLDYDNSNGQYQLYFIKEAGENSISVESCQNDIIYAGTPLIVKKLTGSSISIMSRDNSKISATIAPVTSDGYTMNGTYTALTGQTGMYYITGDKLYRASTAITIPAFRAWFTTVNTEAKTLTINIMNADGTTEIESLDANSLSLGEGRGEVFTLSGQRLSAPQKGINIINGKKILVK